MARSLGLRMQKKLLGMTVKSKSVAKAFVDDNTGELLDNLYEVAKMYHKDSKPAKKFMKNMIKIFVKIGFLYNKSQLNDEEQEIGRKLQSKLKMAILTVISYHDVAFTFDAAFLTGLFTGIKEQLHALIARHLTDRSKERVDHVFQFFCNADMLAHLYTDPAYKDVFERVIRCLNKIVESNVL